MEKPAQLQALAQEIARALGLSEWRRNIHTYAIGTANDLGDAIGRTVRTASDVETALEVLRKAIIDGSKTDAKEDPKPEPAEVDPAPRIKGPVPRAPEAPESDGTASVF